MNRFSRRHFAQLAGGAAWLAGCSQGADTKRADTSGPKVDAADIAESGAPAVFAEFPVIDTPLKTLAAQKGLRFGTAIGHGESSGLDDDAYGALIKRECNVLVAENEHKLYSTLGGGPEPMTFARGDAIVDFAIENGMDMRGHVLLWNRMDFTPDWVSAYDFGKDSRAGMAKWLDGYIKDLTGHYGTKIYSWDVVNETIDPATGHPRETIFTQKYGPDVVDFAFRSAREHAPHAELVYNDYMIWEPNNEAHIAGVLRLLEGFKNRDVPIDAFGVQGHLSTQNHTGRTTGDGKGYTDPQRAEFTRFLDEIVGMGYNLIVSEFDVNDTDLVADPDVRDLQMASYGGAFLDMMLSYQQVKDVLMWGMADHHSWLREWWPRSDAALKRPALYDDQLRPKALRQAVAKSLINALAR
ncbi:endo-1,4-beta-xylanase [Robiginitomaculum antarcticum]|uniref:endo-1,4-beta-xylanase n=1 Tax=Robiginitomaculum antarcticum TaxID=437507 RepID=UPI00035E430C|nr:endo-1,4-beta-xylanase [Robiginitomaculum antarcticum]